MSLSSQPQAPTAEWTALLRLWRAVYGRRWMVALFVLVATGIGTGVVLLLPSYYQSGAALQAENSGSSPLTGALAGLASQFTNLQLPMQGNPQLLADLLTTDAVLLRVAADSFQWNGKSASLSTIYGYEGRPPLLRDDATLRKLRKSVGVSVDNRTGIVRFSVETRSGELSKAVAESLIGSVNAANVQLRQARASADLAFMAARAQEAQDDLSAAESTLAAFTAQNRVITSSPELMMKDVELRRSVDMRQQVYVQLRLQQEQSAIQAVRNTPTIAVLDPPRVPARRSWPTRPFGPMIGFLVGALLAVARLLLLPG